MLIFLAIKVHVLRGHKRLHFFLPSSIKFAPKSQAVLIQEATNLLWVTVVSTLLAHHNIWCFWMNSSQERHKFRRVIFGLAFPSLPLGNGQELCTTVLQHATCMLLIFGTKKTHKCGGKRNSRTICELESDSFYVCAKNLHNSCCFWELCSWTLNNVAIKNFRPSHRGPDHLDKYL